MSNYRLYLMDEQGRHIDDVMLLEAATDEEALDVAGKTAPRRFRELWRLQRQLGALRPQPRYEEIRFAA